MNFRRAAALALVGALAFGLAGCVGTPAAKPSTSAPAFASDEEAYKAAEKVYREYVDALNKVDLADPKTFEPVFALTTGDANANDREHFSQMHADGWAVSGAERISLLRPESVGEGARSANLAVCLDVSAIHLVDKDGASQVSAERPNVQSMTVTVEFKNGERKIAAFGPRDGEPSCGS